VHESSLFTTLLTRNTKIAGLY